MPDIMELIAQQEQKRNPITPQNPQEQGMNDYGQQQGLPEDGLLPSGGNATGDPADKQQQINQIYSDAALGKGSGKLNQETFLDPDSWSPEYSARGWFDEAGQSVMRGIGKHIIKGTGDLIQALGGYVDPDIVQGTWLTKALQEAGTDFEEKFRSYMPEELQTENLSWASLMNPKFWSTHVAEMIPQLAEFILLSKGGSAIAKGIGGGVLKRLPGTAKTALGEAIPGTGKGLVGKLATEKALTETGKQIFGAVGGGLAGNYFAGLQNAAEIINSNKDLKGPDGKPLYTNEQLSDMAAATVRNNAEWLLIDMASWGMTFGGGYKFLKGLNPIKRGGKIWNSAQQSKIIGKAFSYDVAPVFKGAMSAVGKGVAEGVEEMYQETFEDWAKMRAKESITGEKAEYDNYWDFFNSKENMPTKVISFAVGALGGATWNVADLVNKKADDSYKLYDRAKNLSEIVRKQGTAEELEWQQYHIRKTISDIVADDKVDAYEDFTNYLVENENITEDEKKNYDKMLQEFQETKAKAKRLNVKGITALLKNKSDELYATEKLEEFENVAKENIADIQANDMLTENEKQSKIAEIEATLVKQTKGLGLIMAEAKQNQANLILGKKASPLSIEIKLDENGNEMVIGGLSAEQYYEYTKEGEQEKPSFIELKAGQLKEQGKNIYNNLVNKFVNKNDKSSENEEVTSEEVAEEPVEKKTAEEIVAEQETKVPPSATMQPQGEVISDEIFAEYEKSGYVPDEALETIASNIRAEKPLTERQETIRQAYKDDLMERMVKQTLGTKPKETMAPSPIDNLSPQQVNDIANENQTKITRTKEGYDVTTDLKGKKGQDAIARTKQQIEATAEENISKIDDGDINEKEKNFIKKQINSVGKKAKNTLKQIMESANKVAEKNFKVDPKKTKKAKEFFGKIFGAYDMRNQNNDAEILGAKVLLKYIELIKKNGATMNVTNKIKNPKLKALAQKYNVTITGYTNNVILSETFQNNLKTEVTKILKNVEENLIDDLEGTVDYTIESLTDFFISAGGIGGADNEVLINIDVTPPNLNLYGTDVLDHEIAHVFTLKYLQEEEAFTDNFNLSTFTPTERQFRETVFAAYNAITNSKDFKLEDYGFTNPLEFVAEYLSNNEFRNKVDDYLAKKEIHKSFFDVLKSFYQKLFGINLEEKLLPSLVQHSIDNLFNEQLANANKKPFRSLIAEYRAAGMDKRSPVEAIKGIVKPSIRDWNIKDWSIKRLVLDKIRNRTKLPANEQLSNNALDNYLNRYTTQNLYGPSNIDKMAVVNHNLKNMFPNTKSPVQAIVVRNLFDAIGSQGLAHTLGGTIYIDEKAWNQDNVFMHEMAHIYYQLSPNEPATQELLKMALANKELVAKTKELYNDQILYNMVTPWGTQEVTKGQVFSFFRAKGIDKANYESFLAEAVKLGDLQTIPLSQQKYIIEEMFVAQLEGPLAKNFDKVFNQKNEIQRQKTVKKWWGLLRKKGDIINEEDGVSKMLRKLYNESDIQNGNMKDFIFDVFKTVTKGVTWNAQGLDARSQAINEAYQNELDNIEKMFKEQVNNEPENLNTIADLEDSVDAYETAMEEDAEIFYNRDFDSKIKSTSRILRRFGVVYNKALRTKYLLQNKNKITNKNKYELFDKEGFESYVYNLAKENNDYRAFIYNITHSEIKEIQDFNDFLNEVYPNTKYQLLSSMHYVLSNMTHVAGFKSLMNNNGNHEFDNSLSMGEMGSVDNQLASMFYSFEQKARTFKEFQDAARRIYDDKIPSSEDIRTIVNFIRPTSVRQLSKIYDKGVITYQGTNIPIETLIAGYIKAGRLFNKNSKNVYVYNARPLVEALVQTNRQYTPYSNIMNAEGNTEPVRITNNHLTSEIEDMIDFMSPDENGKKPTKEEFLKRFSHISYKQKKERGKAFVPNQFLENIYDQFNNYGVMPVVSQYHGLRDNDNDKGSLYKNSTALEQGIEDLLIFVESATTKNGRVAQTYLGNLGAFSDSPRKFFMKMKRIPFEKVFKIVGNNYHFQSDGDVVNSIFHINKAMYPGSNDPDASLEMKKQYKVANNKQAFNQMLRESLNESIKFAKENAQQLGKIKKMKDYFDAKKQGDNSIKYVLNKKGEQMIAEYTINSIVNGYNIADVFAPGIKGEEIVKRFKANSSPIMSSKNKNFKIEPIVFADEVINGNKAGTDSAMYILKEDAELWQHLGKGVFNLNSGFKFLNSSIEKDNPNFAGKMAYLKGYTTIVDEKHPLYKIMKARKEKYLEWHRKTYGTEPSKHLNDGTPNHIVIAIPQSSDKSNFFPDAFTKKVNGVEEHTDLGSRFTQEALSQNIDEAMKYYDNMFYNKKGNFMGISGHNFGPQQIMDKETDFANTPVQMVNSIIVNAALNNKLDVAEKIQEHIANQKLANLNKFLEELDNTDGTTAERYRKIVWDRMNKEDMDQAQRLLFEDGGSIAHPYLNQIAVNQLAKTIRRLGNKLKTDGTYAHQKPDYTYRSEANGNKALKGYQDNGDGLLPAEMIAPPNMKNKTFSRQALTVKNAWGKQAIKQAESALGKRQKEQFERVRKSSFLQGDLMLLELAALKLAQDRHGVDEKTAQKYIAKEYDNAGTHIGYHVKGQTVIASRVPGHGPSSTGVFEIMDYHRGDGNQVSVSSEFNEIIGSDNDGDALFIQTKSKKGYEEWNKAFDLMTEYWLSPEMKEQIQAKMVFEDQTKEIVKNIKEKFGLKNEYTMPFSPLQRMRDYNNTMVSKRNVGPVFNIHKITNMLASYKIDNKKTIQINSNQYTGFKDDKRGNLSRNQQSAILANIILDNAKHGFADALGLDEYNVAQAVLLVNMGVSLEQVGEILNSPAAKLWSEYNRKNNSAFHDYIQRDKISKKIEDQLGIKRSKTNGIKINMNGLTASKGQDQAQVLDLLNYLSDMNSEIQKISTIMSGHKKIHVNPLVLEQQIKDFDNVFKNPQESTLELTEEFKNNSDLKHYREVAEVTLEHLKRINPVYDVNTKQVLVNLVSKIGNDLTPSQIERVSEDLLKFKTSRLLGLNNKPREYVENLLDQDPANKESIFNKIKKYQESLKNEVIEDPKDVRKGYSLLDNSILWTRALKYKLDGPTSQTKYIGANTEFVNDSFNKAEREQAQREFTELPAELRNDLILYDMVKNGWAGKLSMSPFFSKTTNSFINNAANENIENKNTDKIDPNILQQLEHAIALKYVQERSNPFTKVVLDQNQDINNPEHVVAKIMNKKSGLLSRIQQGKPMYVSVRKGRTKKLYEMKPFTAEELGQVASERSWSKKTQRVELIAKTKFQEVENILPTDTRNTNVAITNIRDNSLYEPYVAYDENQYDTSLDYLTEASIKFEDAMAELRRSVGNQTLGMDAREDFYIDTFTRTEPLTQQEYNKAMEFKPYMSDAIKKTMWEKYVGEKRKANQLYKSGLVDNLESKSSEWLVDKYNELAEQDVYAYSIVITPIAKALAYKLAQEQSELTKRSQDNQDVSPMKAWMMSGSTIPSNHPASQGLARILETEYKNFIDEKKRYIQEMNEITDALYKEKLGYGGRVNMSLQGIKNFLQRIKDAVITNREDIYNRLYGKLVIREERINDKGTMVLNYKLRPKEEVEKGFKEGYITKAEMDFYNFFRKTTNDLMPSTVKKVEQDYIPHTSMSRLELFSSRGLLGLLANSRHEDQSIYDVKMNFNGGIVNFKQIEDYYKIESARGKKNDLNSIQEYRAYKRKAKELLKSGKNEDGSRILFDAPFVETALGFGAINRFANNRSIKAQELPSMDLNKALGDYIHSSIFVNGHGKFKGMLKLQPYIEGVLAWNEQHDLKNMNTHVQKVWKDYFLRQKRQESFAGEAVDRVVYGLTRLNLFYALGYSANKNTGGLYALGNILAGKYHNIKDLGGKAWVLGEARYWGLDQGFKNGITGINQRRKRMANIMKEINFMEINVYDEVNIEKRHGLDRIITDIALSPMILSEEWIQRVHMLGLLTDEELNRFDDEGKLKSGYAYGVSPERLIELEDRVKSSHGRGYQPTDQRAAQMYSWGTMMLQFSRFIPTMIHDRFGKEDVNIYGKETIGSMRAVGKMLRYVMNSPQDYKAYRESLSPEQRQRLDSGLKGVAMSTIISMAGASDLYWDTNYYWDYARLSGKLTPPAIRTTSNLVSSLF